MSKAIRIIKDGEEIKLNEESKYPELPFIVQDVYDDLWLVYFDSDSERYCHIDLQTGESTNSSYTSLDEMFKNEYNESDKIVNVDFVIKGEFKIKNP